MADIVQAGAPVGTGPKFAADTDTAGLNWPFSKLAFGTLHTTYAIVDDLVGQRLPVKTTPDGVTTTDASGTVTVASGDQIAIAANTSRKGGTIINPPSAVESLFIDFGIAASVSTGRSIELAPGQSFDLNRGAVVITDAVHVTALTAGHVFQAKSFG